MSCKWFTFLILFWVRVGPPVPSPVSCCPELLLGLPDIFCVFLDVQFASRCLNVTFTSSSVCSSAFLSIFALPSSLSPICVQFCSWTICVVTKSVVWLETDLCADQNSKLSGQSPRREQTLACGLLAWGNVQIASLYVGVLYPLTKIHTLLLIIREARRDEMIKSCFHDLSHWLSVPGAI